MRLLQDVIHMRLYNFNILYMFSDEVYNLLISHVPCFFATFVSRKLRSTPDRFTRLQIQPVQMVYQLFGDTPKSSKS